MTSTDARGARSAGEPRSQGGVSDETGPSFADLRGVGSGGPYNSQNYSRDLPFPGAGLPARPLWGNHSGMERGQALLSAKAS